MAAAGETTSMDQESIMTDLRRKANQIRNQVLEMCICAGGHIASSFSCVEILVALYYAGILHIDPANPDDGNRDRFILSKGHAETVFYAVLADRGFFPSEWLTDCYRTGDCRLGGHPDHKTPGVEITSGALGHGLGIAAGIAFAARQDARPHYQYVLMGDAECTEGSVWEAALFAARHKLGNLIAIVDRNHIGSIDFTENYSQLEPFAEKWTTFGWDVRTVDGHNIEELVAVLRQGRSPRDGRPFMVVAETVKGKGISFMENDPTWHVKSMHDADEIAIARKELQWG